MSELGEMARHYNEIRERLMSPPNAVFDKGINLHPNRIPSAQHLPIVKPTVLDNSISCKVIIRIIPKPPIEPVIPRTVKFTSIRKAVCLHYGVTWNQIINKSRRARICLPRHVLCYLAYQHTGLSMPQVARLLKRRDHTTVLHGRDKIREMLLVDEDLVSLIKLIEYEVFAGYYDTDENILGPTYQKSGDGNGTAI